MPGVGGTDGGRVRESRMGGLSDESPEGCASGGGRKGAYLDLDAELAELAGGELDGDADAGRRRRHFTRAGTE